MIRQWVLNSRDGNNMNFLLHAPIVTRILVVRHPTVRFWSTWNQKFLKGQVIGRDICNRSELKDECDTAEEDESATHYASFKTFVGAFLNEANWVRSGL